MRNRAAYYGKDLGKLCSIKRTIYLTTDKYLELFVHHKNNNLMHARQAEFIENLRGRLYDTAKIFTGEISVDAFKAYYENGTIPTPEHKYNRARASRDIFAMLSDWGQYKIGTRELYYKFLEACSVHQTTPEENRRLEKFQNDPNLMHMNPDEIYALAEVYRIIKPSKSKKTLFIDGMEFENEKHASSVLGITQAEILRNLKDKTQLNWYKKTHADVIYDEYFLNRTKEETLDLLRKDNLIIEGNIR